MLEEERVLDDVVGAGGLDLAGRVGLGSCWLFLRDLRPLTLLDDAARRVFRVGDGSREAIGDCVTELLVEDCLDV